MTESEINAINNHIRDFRAYFKSQLKNTITFPINCNLCETLLKKNETFYQYTIIDKWALIRTDLFRYLESNNFDNNHKPINEDLWEKFGKELTNQPIIFVCAKCLPQATMNLDFSILFSNKDIPKKSKSGSLKNILKPENPDSHSKFFNMITRILKKPNQNSQNNIWEILNSKINLLADTDNISTHLTEWMTIIENIKYIPNTLNPLIYPLSTIGLLIPKTDCKQFSKCLSKLSKQEISEIFHLMAKREKYYDWYVIIEKLDYNIQKIILLKIIQNHNSKILKKIFENIVNYSISFQNYLFDKLDSLDDITLWEKLIEKIPIEKYSDLDQKIKEKFKAILDNYQKEKSEVKKLYDIYLKRNRENSLTGIKSFRKTALLLTKRYRKIIEQHIINYKEEFTTFFKKLPEPILGFDIEEIERNMICVMGVKINPDLSIQVTTQVINDIFHLNRSSGELEKKFEHWIKNQDSKYVITHGSNTKESNLIKKSKSIDINSEEFLLNIRQTQKIEENYLLGIGLRYFEMYINFNRKGCGIIKHRTIPDLFFDQFQVSLDRHLWQETQRQCNLCGKTQDVLLYCLEDAFVSMLIVVWCVNRNLIPENLKKLF